MGITLSFLFFYFLFSITSFALFPLPSPRVMVSVVFPQLVSRMAQLFFGLQIAQFLRYASLMILRWYRQSVKSCLGRAPRYLCVRCISVAKKIKKINIKYPANWKFKFVRRNLKSEYESEPWMVWKKRGLWGEVLILLLFWYDYSIPPYQFGL